MRAIEGITVRLHACGLVKGRISTSAGAARGCKAPRSMDAGNVIETHEHVGDFKEWSAFTMNGLEETKKKRFQFLNKLHDLTGGSSRVFVSMWQVGEQLGWG